jgi:hypothetical protein
MRSICIERSELCKWQNHYVLVVAITWGLLLYSLTFISISQLGAGSGSRGSTHSPVQRVRRRTENTLSIGVILRKAWPWTIVGVVFRECYNARMLHCQNVAMPECYIIRMVHFQNVTMPECYIIRMLHCQNVTLSECCNARVLHYQNVTLSECYNARMLHYQNVTLSECYIVKMLKTFFLHSLM